jgi:Domain of unknown function (DUF3597)
MKHASGPFAEAITIRPDAITGNRSWPCRELNYHRTPNHRSNRSRFGESCIIAMQNACVAPPSFGHHKLIGGTSCRIASSSAAAKLSGDPAYAPPPKQAPSSPSHDFQIHREQTMSIFGKIMSAIFGTKADAAPAGGGATAGTATGTGSGAGSSSTSAAPAQTVEVAPILDKAVAAKKEKLEWRTSIVDLMKALDIDSSLGARKELAKELGYTGDTNDSASMNIWLHKQVMTKLAANGGKLPPDIKR